MAISQLDTRACIFCGNLRYEHAEDGTCPTSIKTEVARPSPPSETYIGDGVYASREGCDLKVRTARRGGDHFIYFEPQMIGELMRYAAAHGFEETVLQVARELLRDNGECVS